MSAAEKTGRVYFELSELDKEDGVSIKTQYRNLVFRSAQDRNTLTYNTGLDAKGINKVTTWEQMVQFSPKSVAKTTNVVDMHAVVTAGNVLVYEGSYVDFVDQAIFADYNNVNVELSLKVNDLGVDGGTDDIDDRTQKNYLVKLEKGIGSGLFTVAGNYTVNKGDDLAKLVKEGEYTNLPGLYDYEFDKDGNEYVYQYTIEDDTIYGRWVKEGSPLFGKVEVEKEYDELDANKDGVVSCEEALGKGWVWNNETSACELKGSSNTGSYVPNTATK